GRRRRSPAGAAPSSRGWRAGSSNCAGSWAMTELERGLRALGAVVELPPVPELGPRVRARLAEPPRRRLRRPLALALALVVLALGAAFAVPQSRGAILRFLGIEGVTVIRSEKLPPLATGPVAPGR